MASRFFIPLRSLLLACLLSASARELADAYLAYFTLHGRVLQSAYEWNVALATLARATGELSPPSKEH